MCIHSIYRSLWIAIALGSCLNVRPRTWASCREPHTHTHAHAHAAVSLAVLLIILRTQPHTRASQCSGHYMDCLACGDLSVWDSTILSRQGENTYFGCFSQHQKRPSITLNWDVLKKKKKSLNSKSACGRNEARVALGFHVQDAPLPFAEHLALPARERQAACRASRSNALICERAFCLQAMSAVFLVGWESEPDYPKKTEAKVKHGGFNTVRGAQFPIRPGCKYTSFNLKSQNLKCAPWFQKPWNIK